jgi:uncharacterized paraquat-inducible protein A
MRDMTEDEFYSFEGHAEHTNMGGHTACCPKCVESVALSESAQEDAKVATCSKCGTEFAVWMEMVPHVYSAPLPN